jgi:hypothetical protein
VVVVMMCVRGLLYTRHSSRVSRDRHVTGEKWYGGGGGSEVVDVCIEEETADGCCTLQQSTLGSLGEQQQRRP